MEAKSRFIGKDFSKGEVLCIGDTVYIKGQNKIGTIYQISDFEPKVYKLIIDGKKEEGQWWQVGYDEDQLILKERGIQSYLIENQVNKIYNSKGKIVRHFKGDLYLIEDFAICSETSKLFVVYKGLYEDCQTYIRPFDMFVELIDTERAVKYNQLFRFELIDIESKNK